MRSEWRSPQGHTRAFTRMAAPLPTAACQPPSCQRTALPCRGPLGARGQVSACVQSPGGSTCRKRCSGQGAEPRPARRLARLESATSLRDADGPTRPAWAFCQGPSHTQVYAQAQPANAHCTPTRNPPPTDAHPAVTGTRCRASVLRAVRGGGVGSAHVRAPLNKPRTRSPVRRTSRTRAKLGTRWQISFPELHGRTRAPERRAHGTGTERHVSARSPRSTQPHEGPAHKEDGP